MGESNFRLPAKKRLSRVVDFPGFFFFSFLPFFFARNKIKIQGMKISLLLLHFLRYLDLPRDWTSLSFCANANSSSLFSCSCVSLITIEISSFNPSGIRNMIDLRVSKCCGNSHNVLAQILLCFFVTTAEASSFSGSPQCVNGSFLVQKLQILEEL